MLQPNYIPWKGVFDLINQVDVFVFYDDVQYTVKDWRNRNIIKTQHGDKWLSVPVIHKGLRGQLICDTEINNTQDWQKDHYKTIKFSYIKAPYFKDILGPLKGPPKGPVKSEMSRNGIRINLLS